MRYGVADVSAKKKRGITEPRQPPPRPQRIRVPFGALFRMFVLGSVAIGASLWALWRHYNVPRPPMLVPVVASSAPASVGTEIEIEPLPP